MHLNSQPRHKNPLSRVPHKQLSCRPGDSCRPDPGDSSQSHTQSQKVKLCKYLTLLKYTSLHSSCLKAFSFAVEPCKTASQKTERLFIGKSVITVASELDGMRSQSCNFVIPQFISYVLVNYLYNKKFTCPERIPTSKTFFYSIFKKKKSFFSQCILHRAISVKVFTGPLEPCTQIKPLLLNA